MTGLDDRTRIAELLSTLDDQASEGFALGLHIGQRGPKFLFSTFPPDWLEYYTANGLQLRDPAVAWSLRNEGHIQWRELAENDPANVIGLAREHGLLYGATMALVSQGSRSVFGCYRIDREFLDAELTAMKPTILSLHGMTFGQERLPEKLETDLKRMSIRLSHG